MKMMKSGIVVIGLVMLLMLSITVSAETVTDGQGDVFYWDLTYPIGTVPTYVDKPNIDITSLSVVYNGDQVTVSMETAGPITLGSNTLYHMYYNTSEALYSINAIAGEAFATGLLRPELLAELTPAEIMEYQASYPDVIITGNTMSATFDIVGDDTSTDALWGNSMQIDESAGIAAGWWDYAPNDYIPYEFGEEDSGTEETNGDTTGETNEGTTTTNDGSPEPSTPGFETLAILAALGVAYIILRKRN